jgi:hypothetical protein
MDNLTQAFNQFISIRMEYIADSVLHQSNDYKQSILECNQLFQDLQENLPQQYKEILQDYDTNTTLLQGIAESLMYKQGLKDGYRLKQMLTDS